MSLSRPSTPPELIKYELLDEIGHGGMATVYRARDIRLGRDVAVKLIHPHLRENREAAARFITEARAVAKLKHPGIVEVFDVSDVDDRERFLVAELIRGPSLRKLLSDQGHFPAEIAACFGAQLCDALGHAHSAGIVHRDVKPENVLVEVDSVRSIAQAKLTDFGIAKVMDAQGVTSTGQVLGSPAHMAPEQIEGSQVDARADVFSLGVLIYECMVGKLPFEGKNPAQVLRKVLDCCYVPADRERPTVGARWAAVLAHAIARRPEERYPGVKQFGEAIRRELLDMGITDSRAELYQYLQSPEEYARQYSKKVVARLMSRAQAERRNRHIQQAAADLNRAVAYSPDDPEILRQVTSLAQGQWRRSTFKKGLWVSALVAVLAGSAPVVAKLFKRAPPEPAVIPSAVSDGFVGNSPSAAYSAPLEAASVPVPVVASRHLPVPRASVIPVKRPSEVNEVHERHVIIEADPKSALVSIDDGPPAPVGFSGLSRRLTVGRHKLTFSVPEGNPCCLPSTTYQEVTPDDGNPAPQRIHGRPKFNPARIAVTGAPPDGRLHCRFIGVNIGPNEIKEVQMNSSTMVVSCMKVGPEGGSAQPMLQAGATTTVRWAN